MYLFAPLKLFACDHFSKIQKCLSELLKGLTVLSFRVLESWRLQDFLVMTQAFIKIVFELAVASSQNQLKVVMLER